MIKKFNFKIKDYENIPDIEIVNGFTYSETNNDEISQSLTLKIYHKNRDIIKNLDCIKLEVDNFRRCLIVADIEKSFSIMQQEYSFIMFLVSPTKYLEKVICPSMSFTNKDDSLLDILEKALLNAEIVEKGKNPRFYIKPEIVNFLNGIKGADYYFNAPITLKEILDEIFSQINARVIVKEITDYNNIEIDFVDINERKNLINLELEKRKHNYNSNLELTSSDIESYVSNAILDKLYLIYEPSPNGWTTFKTKEAILTTNNAMISTKYGIEEIIEFYVKGNFLLKAREKNPPYNEITLLSLNEINIISNVVNNEIYLILNNKSVGMSEIETDQLFKENVISYTKGETDIMNIRYNNLLWFKSDNFQSAILNSFWKSYEVQNEINKGNYTNYTVSTSDSFSLEAFLFRVGYKPQFDAHLKISKANYDFEAKTTIISQQTAKQVDIIRFGDNLFGQVNRLGNNLLSVDFNLEDINNLYNLNDYTKDNYVINKIDIAFFIKFNEKHYRVNYILSKNFNELSSRIGISREKRVYSIPLEYFNVDTIIQNKIEASFNPNINVSFIVREIIKVLKKQENEMRITNVLVKTKSENNESDYFELPVNAYCSSNNINFNFSFADNYSAGMSVVGQVFGGKKVISNPYVNDKGEYEEIEIILFNDEIKNEVVDPLIHARELPKTNFDLYDKYNFHFAKTYQKKKDAYEHHSFTISFEIVSKEKDIIIGEAFTKDNPLWFSARLNQYVYISFDEIYNVGDKLVKGAKADLQNITITNKSVSVSFNENNIKSWAIGNEDRNLYIACNKVETREIFFQLK